MKQNIFILAITLLTSKIFACSCDTMPFDKAVEWADEIFMGRIIQMEELDNSKNEGQTHTSLWGATFEVTKKWKGSTDKYLTIVQSNESCDFFFNFPDNEYIVYARHVEDPVALMTYLCTRNADATTYNNWTGKGWDDRPLLDKQFPTPVQLSTISTSWTLYGLGVLIIFGVLTIWIIKKIKQRHANSTYPQAGA